MARLQLPRKLHGMLMMWRSATIRHDRQLLGCRIQLDLRRALDLEVVVVAGGVQLGAQVVDQVGIGSALQLRRFVIGAKRRQDLVGAVDEVEDVGGVLARMGAVQARQGLHRLDSRRITAQAGAAPATPFCARVVTIEFNAWHYVDANLLASLVGHILDCLARYLNPNDPGAERAKLIGQLVSARTAVDEVKVEKAASAKSLEDQHTRLKELEEQRLSAELRLRDLRSADFREIRSANKELEQNVKQALESLGAPTALARIEDLDAALSETNSLAGRAGGLVVM
jgi:hypothetical protein